MRQIGDLSAAYPAEGTAGRVGSDRDEVVGVHQRAALADRGSGRTPGLPLGEPLTLDSLPPPDTMRWVVRRKAEVVAAVSAACVSANAISRRFWKSRFASSYSSSVMSPRPTSDSV